MKDLMFGIKDCVLWILSEPAAIMYIVFNAVIMVVWAAYLGKGFLIGVCAFLGLFVLAVVASLLSVFVDNCKENEKNKQMR